MENKEKILELLLPVIGETREKDVVGLEYQKARGCAYETVVVHYKSGHRMNVNVTADSGLAMIIDVCRAII